MDSKFKRGDVIKEKCFENTMRYVVLDTVEMQWTRLFSASGFSATIRRDTERCYEKIGHIDLGPLMQQIRKGGVSE